MITLEAVVDVLWSPSWSVVVFYGALVLVLAFRPQGLLGRKARGPNEHGHPFDQRLTGAACCSGWAAWPCCWSSRSIFPLGDHQRAVHPVRREHR